MPNVLAPGEQMQERPVEMISNVGLQDVASRICHTRPKFFFSLARQVYNQDLYTTLIVVVNGGRFLWTTRLNSEKSGIYATYKSVHC